MALAPRFHLDSLLHVIVALVERIVLLNFGQELAEGTPEAIVADQAVIGTYLGVALERGAGGAQHGR